MATPQPYSSYLMGNRHAGWTAADWSYTPEFLAHNKAMMQAGARPREKKSSGVPRGRAAPAANLDLNTLMGLYQQQQAANQPQQADPLALAYMQQMNAANFANEQRYGDILQGLVGRYDRNMGRVEDLGGQERADINERMNRLGASRASDLTGRGLGGATVRGAAQRRTERDRTSELNRLQDQITRQQVDTDTRLTGDVFSFMERKNEQQPDLNQLIGLNQALGTAGVSPNYGGGAMFGQYPQPGGYPGGWTGADPRMGGQQGGFGGMQGGFMGAQGGLNPFHMGPRPNGQPSGPVLAGQQLGGMQNPYGSPGGFPGNPFHMGPGAGGAPGGPQMGGYMQGRALRAQRSRIPGLIDQNMQQLLQNNLQGLRNPQPAQQQGSPSYRPNIGQYTQGGGGGYSGGTITAKAASQMYGGGMGGGIYNVPGMGYGLPGYRGGGWNGADPRMAGGGGQQAQGSPWMTGMQGTVGQPINWNRGQQRRPMTGNAAQALNQYGPYVA